MKLEDLKKICDEATPGPWAPFNERDQVDLDDESYAHTYTYKTPDDEPAWETDCGQPGYGVTKQDIEFIAAARTMLPKLLAVAESIRRDHLPHCGHCALCDEFAALEAE